MILVFFALTAALTATSVPNGGCILVNGAVGAGEWDDSGSLRLDSETELRFHQDEENLFLAIVFHGPRHTGVDLYLATAGKTRMLHVSSAVGEKVLEQDEWSEFTWGRNSWWTANQIGSIHEDGRQRWLEPDAFEFQIDRSELGSAVRLFLHLKRPEKMLPPAGTAADAEGWIRLDLE